MLTHIVCWVVFAGIVLIAAELAWTRLQAVRDSRRATRHTRELAAAARHHPGPVNRGRR